MLNLSAAHLLTLHGLVTSVAILLYVITSHVMQQRRHPTAAIAWMLFILLVPYLALPTFLIIGSRKLKRRRADSRPEPLTDAADSWAVETLIALGQAAPAPYSKLHVHQNGLQAQEALLAILDAAQHSIDLCTFILRRDRLGDAVIDLLCAKARSGVRVRLMLDGLGSLMGGRPKLKRLTQAGGTYALFMPLLSSMLRGRANLRDHRKMVVVDAGLDAASLWCGGRNLSAEYFVGGDGVPVWRDLSFDLQGPLVRQAAAMFERDWSFANRLAIAPQQPAPPQMSCPPDAAQLVASGPDQMDDTLYALLITAAYRAGRRIVLVTPYFVPDSALLMALCLAARRGVSVDLLLPARSNHRLSDLARARALRSLVQAGARVWLAPDMLHAKLAVFDDQLALAGSANFDSRSLFLNYELMIAFHKTTDVQRFAAWFERERLSARGYVPARPGLMRDIADGMLLWLAFQL